MAVNQAVGGFGERHAARFLEERGLIVIARNWRCPLGELDLVALDGPTLVGVEVKTRRSVAFGLPIEAITPRKAERLRTLLVQYLQQHADCYDAVRIDAVTVIMPTGEPIETMHHVGIA